MRCGKGSDGRKQRAVKLRKALTAPHSQGRLHRRHARRSKTRKGRKVMSRCSKQNDLHMQKPGGMKEHGILRDMQAVLTFQGRREESRQGPAQGEILLRAREQLTKVGCYNFFPSTKSFLQIGQILYVPRDPSNKSNMCLGASTSS